MMASCVVAQRRDRHDRREAAAVLADVGQLVDVLDAARGLEHQRLEARRDRGAELDAQRLGARDHFLRIGDVGRRDLVHHVGGRVAQHALGADVEDLDDALRVGGDAREVGAVENRVLQGPGLEQGLLAPDLGDAFGRARGGPWMEAAPGLPGHGRSSPRRRRRDTRRTGLACRGARVSTGRGRPRSSRPRRRRSWSRHGPAPGRTGWVSAGAGGRKVAGRGGGEAAAVDGVMRLPESTHRARIGNATRFQTGWIPAGIPGRV